MAVAVGCIARVPFLCACVRAYNASDGCKEDKQICYSLEMETGLFLACVQQPFWPGLAK